jgi:hypothetical protein
MMGYESTHKWVLRICLATTIISEWLLLMFNCIRDT